MPQISTPPEAALAYQVLGLAFALFVWVMAFSEWQRTRNRDYYVIGLAFTILIIRQLFPYIFFVIDYLSAQPISRSFTILVTYAWENLSFAIMAGVVIIRMARSHLRFEKLLITYFGFVFLLVLEIVLFDRLLPHRDLMVWTPFLFTMLNIVILSFAIASCYALRRSINHFFRKAFWLFYVHQVVVFFFYFNKSNSAFKYLANMFPILGALFVVLAVYTSIRNEIESKSQRLKQLDATKSRFMAVVSHELRTPLSSMKMSYDMLLSGKLGGLTSQQHDALAVIKNNADRLIRMIEELLDVSRVERGTFSLNLKKANLTEFVRTVGKEFETGLLRRSKELVVEFPQEPIHTHFDSDKLSQVIINLLHNGDRYNRPEGLLKLTVKDSPKLVVFDVEDQGPGIPADKVDEVFDSFVRAGRGASGKGGLGLGLHIAKQIVEAHGGSIMIIKTGEEGTKIRFTLSKELGSGEAGRPDEESGK